MHITALKFTHGYLLNLADRTAVKIPPATQNPTPNIGNDRGNGRRSDCLIANESTMALRMRIVAQLKSATERAKNANEFFMVPP